MKRLSLSLALLCAGLSLSAQLTAVSYEEALRGFERQYVEKEKKMDLESYNRIICYAESSGPDDPGDLEACIYITKSEKLNNAGSITLPPSLFMLYLDKDWRRQLLYLRTKGDTENATYRKLKAEYGEVVVNDSLAGVPAKWVDGRIFFTTLYAQYYGGLFVDIYFANALDVGSEIKKVYLNNAPERRRTLLRKTMNNLIQGYNSLHDNITVWLDSWVDGREESKQALALLAHDVNLLLPPDKEFTDTIRHNVVFEVDSTWKIHLRIPHADHLTDADRHRLSELAATLERMEDVGLQPLYTDDGRVLPYFYVEAAYTARGWEFADHMWIGNKVDRGFSPDYRGAYCYIRWTRRFEANYYYPTGLFPTRSDVVTAIEEVMRNW